MVLCWICRILLAAGLIGWIVYSLRIIFPREKIPETRILEIVEDERKAA